MPCRGPAPATISSHSLPRCTPSTTFRSQRGRSTERWWRWLQSVFLLWPPCTLPGLRPASCPQKRCATSNGGGGTNGLRKQSARFVSGLTLHGLAPCDQRHIARVHIGYTVSGIRSSEWGMAAFRDAPWSNGNEATQMHLRFAGGFPAASSRVRTASCIEGDVVCI